MGTVYLAHDDRLRRRVALKILHTEQLLSGTTSMQEEFRAVASLRHPRLARAYDFGYTESGLPDCNADARLVPAAMSAASSIRFPLQSAAWAAPLAARQKTNPAAIVR
jgi:serine/threonine protein kinase